MINITSINVSKSSNGFDNVVKSINWSYTYNDYTISGTENVSEPNPLEFTPLEELTNEIVLTWLENVKDFTQYNVNMIEPISEEETIIIKL
jgi:hypothetical protein